MAGVNLDIGDELVDRIARRVAKLIASREATAASDGWLRGADKFAAYIDASHSRVYAFVSAKGNSGPSRPLDAYRAALRAGCVTAEW